MKYRILIVEDNIMLAGQQKKRFHYLMEHHLECLPVYLYHNEFCF